MRLYHGTNVEFDVIDISKSNRFKDFGRGFYLTDIYQQAADLSIKRTQREGGIPTIMEYEFDEKIINESSLKVMFFESPTAEWAEFIYKNRNRKTPEYEHEYDIVIGPIANDGVAYLLDRYEEGSFTIKQLARQLKYKKLNRQYLFKTPKAISYLKRVK